MGGRGVWCVDAGVSLVSPCFPQPPPPASSQPSPPPKTGVCTQGQGGGKVIDPGSVPMAAPPKDGIQQIRFGPLCAQFFGSNLPPMTDITSHFV